MGIALARPARAVIDVGMLAYLPIVAPIIAIINGAIAVYASHFKPEERRIKLALLAVAIGLGVTAAGATIWSQHVIVQNQEAQEAKRAEIQQRIAGYITTSTQVMRDLQTPSVDEREAEAAAERWYRATAAYVATLGPDYSARFENLYGMTSISPGSITGQDRINTFLGVYYRNIRLEQIASELAR